MDNDLISRSALTEAEKIICKMYLEDLDKFHTCNEYKLLMSLIDNAPTVETEITNEDLQNAMTESFKNGYEMAKAKYERPQGEWVWEEEWVESTTEHPAECDWAGWICSNCRQFPDEGAWDEPDTPPKFNFCPNCGARMIKGGAE